MSFKAQAGVNTHKDFSKFCFGLHTRHYPIWSPIQDFSTINLELYTSWDENHPKIHCEMDTKILWLEESASLCQAIGAGLHLKSRSSTISGHMVYLVSTIPSNGSDKFSTSCIFQGGARIGVISLLKDDGSGWGSFTLYMATWSRATCQRTKYSILVLLKMELKIRFAPQ